MPIDLRDHLSRKTPQCSVKRALLGPCAVLLANTCAPLSSDVAKRGADGSVAHAVAAEISFSGKAGRPPEARPEPAGFVVAH